MSIDNRNTIDYVLNFNKLLQCTIYCFYTFYSFVYGQNNFEKMENNGFAIIEFKNCNPPTLIFQRVDFQVAQCLQVKNLYVQCISLSSPLCQLASE